MMRPPQLMDEQGRIETDVHNGKPHHYSDPGAMVDVSESRNPADKWRRQSVRYFMDKSIPPPDYAPLRQASSQMERDGLLYCSGCKTYHPKSDFSRVKLPRHHQTATGYSKTALQKRGYRYWCKDYEAAHARQRYYGRLGDKAQDIAKSA